MGQRRRAGCAFCARSNYALPGNALRALREALARQLGKGPKRDKLHPPRSGYGRLWRTVEAARSSTGRFPACHGRNQGFQAWRSGGRRREGTCACAAPFEVANLLPTAFPAAPTWVPHPGGFPYQLWGLLALAGVGKVPVDPPEADGLRRISLIPLVGEAAAAGCPV